MKSVIVRALWGTPDNNMKHGSLGHWYTSKTVLEVRKRALDLWPVPCVTLAFGLQNFTFLKSLGVDAMLIDREELRWSDTINASWRHKIVAMRIALEHFEEIIYVDHDVDCCVSCLPLDFWQRRRSGAPFQSPLIQYRKARCFWRNIARRCVPAGAWMYCRDSTCIDRLLVLSEQNPAFDDETCAALMTDELSPGMWDEGLERGIKKYIGQYDPGCVVGWKIANSAADRLFRRRRRLV